MIAKNVKEIIKNKGLKQYVVADMAGYSTKAFNDMLNGRKVITDVDVLNIATILETSIDNLYGIKKEPIKEILVMTEEDELVASITKENIIEKDGYKVVCMSEKN